MSKVSFASLTVLCAALAACSDSATNGAVTAPNARPSFSEAAAELGLTYDLDGSFDLSSATEDASVQMAAAQMFGAQLAPQAASGGRASGHVGFPTGVPGLGIASEDYSFIALSTDPATPFSAKGEFELNLTTVAGVTNKVHGNVICMGITGNTARIAGQITKAWRNGIPVVPSRPNTVWVVVDNGEGQGAPPDQVSLMGFQTAALAATHCALGTPTIVFPNQQGNIQVQP